MITHWRTTIWQQFGAAIDMLENAVVACPDALWGDRSRNPEYWYLVYHTLFWLDYYLAESPQEFRPPAPYNLDELDPRGLFPDRAYTKGEMLAYLEHGSAKCRAVIEAMTEEKAHERYQHNTMNLGRAELLLYNLRHVQHHSAQLNLLLRQTIDSAPRWVAQARTTLTAS